MKQGGLYRNRNWLKGLFRVVQNIRDSIQYISQLVQKIREIAQSHELFVYIFTQSFRNKRHLRPLMKKMRKKAKNLFYLRLLMLSLIHVSW